MSKKIIIITLLFIFSSLVKVCIANEIPLLTQNLSLGSTGSEVLLLQQTLNSDPATAIALSGPGSKGNETNFFGSLTKQAVIIFQIKYEISPTAGYVGPLTRTKLNNLILSNNIHTINSQTSSSTSSTTVQTQNIVTGGWNNNNYTNETTNTNNNYQYNSTDKAESSNFGTNINTNQNNGLGTNNWTAANNSSSTGNNTYLIGLLNSLNTNASTTSTTTHTVDIKINGSDNFAEATWPGLPITLNIMIEKSSNDICTGSSIPSVIGWDKNIITDNFVPVSTYDSNIFEIICTNSETKEKYIDDAVFTRLPDIYTVSGSDNSGPDCQASLVKPSASSIAAGIAKIKNLRTCNIPSDWTGLSCRNYSGDTSKPDEFLGIVNCGSAEAATNFRYVLRSYFETNLWRQTGYTGSNKVNIQANSDGTVNWWVSQ